MLDLVREIPERSGAHLLLSTHILSEVEAVCDRLIIIHEGRKAADLPAAQDNLEDVFVEITTGVGKHKP